MKSEGEERIREMVLCACVTYSARSGEISALHHTLSHLAAEEANIHTLQVLRGDLQKHKFLEL